jgi:hypothetical protein
MSDEVENFTPTLHLRWRWVIIGIRYDRVLQQLWQGDKGHQRWLDVPTARDLPVQIEPMQPPMT